jgi:hypothetical protein
VALHIGRLFAIDHVLGDLLLAGREEAGALDVVGEAEPRDDGQDEGRQALDEEQDAPGRDAGAAPDLHDGVAQGAAVRVGQRRPREEDALPEPDPVARVEEGEVHGHAGVHCFCGAEEEAEDYHAILCVYC